jgi:transcriptional regulator with XRE-family HTH domain
MVQRDPIRSAALSDGVRRRGGDNRLGDFLRARREQLSPSAVGLPDAGGRRVPGLRREEVAQMAGVSTDYYIRLEQGRERHPSDQVLECVARALDLDADATHYLFGVAHATPRKRRTVARQQQVSPYLLSMMDGWTDTPALIAGHAKDVLALNPLARMLFGGFERADNLVRMVFLDPIAPSFYADWDQVARSSVAGLRAEAGEDPDDPRLTELVGELSVKSAAFRRLWARHEVRAKKGEDKRFRHPQVGALTLHFEAFTVNSAPGQQLMVYLAEPGSPAADALALLGTLAASEASEASSMRSVPAAPAMSAESESAFPADRRRGGLPAES